MMDNNHLEQLNLDQLNLEQKQKEAVGFNFILNKLTPDSPYGVEKVKKIKPFTRNDQRLLDDHFDNIEKIIIFSENNEKELSKIRHQLMQLKNISGILTKCEQEALHEIELFEVKHFLLTFEKLYHLFLQSVAQLKLNHIHLQPMTHILDILDPEKKRLMSFALDGSFSMSLGKIQTQKLIIEAKIIVNSTDELMYERKQLVLKELEENAKVMEELSLKLRAFIPVFLKNMDYLGELDLLIAKAIWAMEGHGTRPIISQSDTVVLKNMFNPMVVETLKKKSQIITKTSITLTKGTTIITGANMGGKSISMKTMVLNVMLCQMGFYVFAEHAKIPIFDHIVFISGDMQDDNQGLSTFGADIFHLNQLVQRLKNEFAFVALDEFAKGTNPEEGASIVRGVASYLFESGSVCVMSTHYDGVIMSSFKHYQVVGLDLEKLKEIEGHANAFKKQISQYMDYRLIKVDGCQLPPRDALHICQLMGLNEELLQRIKDGYKNQPFG